MLLTIVGCGDNVRGDLNPTEKVIARITALNDAAGRDDAFKSMFVDGAVPSDRESYLGMGYEVVGAPSVSGDQATAETKVIPGVQNSMTGDNARQTDSGGAAQPRTVTWTLVKVGDSWKLKDAPLE